MEPIDEVEQEDSNPSDQVAALIEAKPIDSAMLNKPKYEVTSGPGYTTEKEQYAYLKFVLNPDGEQPVRMPSQISYPSALVQYNQNFTLTLPVGDFTAFVAPQNSLMNTSGAVSRDYRFCTRITTGLPYAGTSWQAFISNSPVFDTSTPGYAGNSFFPYLSTFDSARVIGAVVELTYMGTLTNCSGSIIASASIRPSNSTPYAFSANDVAPSVSQQFNQKIVKKFSASETVRMVWFPVDISCSKLIATPGSTYANLTTVQANFSQLVFLIQGYGFQNNSTIDVKIRFYYEAIPNMSNTQLFAEQRVSCDNWKEQWNELNRISQTDMGKILIQGKLNSK